MDADAQPQNEEAPIDDDEDVENPNSADTDFQNLEKQHKQEEEKLIADRQKKIDARNENWESFQRLDEFEDLNRGKSEKLNFDFRILENQKRDNEKSSNSCRCHKTKKEGALCSLQKSRA